jgi:hypothetical protein
VHNSKTDNKEKNMSFTKITTTQNKFLETYLRGTGRQISAKQAETLFGIKNIRARMTEFRQQGLRVRTAVNTMGNTAYSVSSRDLTGNRSQVF